MISYVLRQCETKYGQFWSSGHLARICPVKSALTQAARAARSQQGSRPGTAQTGSSGASVTLVDDAAEAG